MFIVLSFEVTCYKDRFQPSLLVPLPPPPPSSMSLLCPACAFTVLQPHHRLSPLAEVPSPQEQLLIFYVSALTSMLQGEHTQTPSLDHVLPSHPPFPHCPILVRH